MVGLDLGMRGGGSVPTVSYMGSGEEDTLFSALVPGKGISLRAALQALP